MKTQLVDRLKDKTTILSLLGLSLFIVVYLPAIQIIVQKWLTSEDYSHAFLVIPIILYMGWLKKTVLLDNQPRHASFGLTLIIFATVLYLFALLTQVHTIILLSMFLTIVGVVIYLLGLQAVKELFTPLLLLAMLIPVPEQIVIQVTFPLQIKVSQISEEVIRMFGVPILREGNIMNIPEKRFEVVEACSGLRSIVTFLTLSVIMGYFMLKRTTSKLILLAVSVPTAIFVNIVRVVLMVLLYHFFGLDLTEGIWHTTTGLLVFVLAMLILFLLQMVLEFWEAKDRSLMKRYNN